MIRRIGYESITQCTPFCPAEQRPRISTATESFSITSHEKNTEVLQTRKKTTTTTNKQTNKRANEQTNKQNIVSRKS
jgi:hypothetical protein